LPGAFTSNAWTVTDGAISTTSATPLTIPSFPIGAQLQALSLTIDPGLGIVPGDPVTISDTLTGQNSMTGYVTSYTIGTGALVCQIGCTFQFEIRQIRPHDQNRDGYGIWYDFGIYPDYGPIIQASLANGFLTMVEANRVQVRIPETSTKRLKERTYFASMTMFDGVDTRQAFRAQLPTQYGGVTI
jgi:hypothetical protein